MLRTGDEPILGYRLDKFLGRGQFGDVWKAQAPGGKLVALKFINIIGKQGLKEYRAIQKVKNIQHPHLMPIIAFWILDQEQNVLSDEVLEQIDLSSQGVQVDVRRTQMGEQPIATTLVVAMLLGEASLYDRFEQCQEQGLAGIPVGELLDYMEEAAKGIDFLNRPCHDLGDGPVTIQHCDIKPHNMLLTGGSVQICDFGLARVLEDVRQTRSVAGTPAYIAPESISGRRPSATTDQYSLAITYYEMRTGELPFAEEDRTSQMAIMQAHMKGKLDFALLPPLEGDVLRRATSVEPDSRYPTSLTMVRALRRAVEQQQRGTGDLAGTMMSDDHRMPTMTDLNAPPAAASTELVDSLRPGEAAASRSSGASDTFQGPQFDGTLQVSAAQADQLQSAAAAPPQPAATSSSAAPPSPPSAPPADFRRQRGSKSTMPMVVLAVVLLAAVGGVGFVWWQNAGRSGDNGDGGGDGGGGLATATQAIRFDPPDAQVTLNGRPVTLENGVVELEKPASNQVQVEARHASGQWELSRSYTWDQLKALDFRVALRRTAAAYVAMAWEALDQGDFEQAVEHYRQALSMNRGIAVTPPPHWLEKHEQFVNELAVDPAGNWLASVSDGSAHNAFAWQLLDESPWAEATPLPGQEDLLEAVAISNDGRWAATGGARGRVQVWALGQFEKGSLLPSGLEQDVLALRFDPSNRYLAASSFGNEIAVWEVDQLSSRTEPKFMLLGHEEAASALAFVPGKQQLASGGWDDAVMLWNLPAPGEAANGELKSTPLAGSPEADVNVVAVDSTGAWLAAGSAGGHVVLWNLAHEGAAGVELTRRGASVEALAFSPDGRHLVASDAEGRVMTWQLEPDTTPGQGRAWEKHQGEVVALAISPDSRWLASGGGDKRILLWDLTSEQSEPLALVGHSNKVRALRFVNRRPWLVSAGDDGKIGLWDYRRWAVIDRALRSLGSSPVIEARLPPPAVVPVGAGALH